MGTVADLQTVPLSEVIARLRTSAQGLSTAQAAERLRRDGPNEITQKRRILCWNSPGADPVDARGGWLG